ncbi:hypothetical protein KCU92_g5653, partial [Aureobasidium melanogenum]
MHSFISLLAPLVALLPLVTAQNHLAVLGPDGVSVGYHTNSSDLALAPVGLKNTQAGVIQPSSTLSLQSQTSQTQTIVAFPTEVVALPPIVVSKSTEQPAGSSSVNPPPSQFAVQSPAPLESWAPVQSSKPIEPVATPPTVPNINALSEKPTEWKNYAGQPGPDAAHPMGFWILNRNALKHHISADWAAEDLGSFGSHEIFNFRTATVEPGENLWIPTIPGVSPKLYVGVSPNNNTAEIGEYRDHDTLIEAKFRGGYGHLYFDIDIERGFSSPVWCHGQGDAWEEGQGCVADLLSVCPVKDQHRDPSTGLYNQCRGAADNIDFRRQYCPKTYVVFDDDWNTKTTSNKDVLMCTIIDTASTSKIQTAQLAEAERKEAAGIAPTAVLPRRALPRGHSKNKRSPGHA